MNLGTWDDVATLEAAVPSERLRQVLTHAEAGQFSEKSWHFWHLRLHVAELGSIPPLPQRKFE
ncbi:hypothetical protein [Hydrocarboniphaga sp.]|uniref:hypothetical protein n=1 Tax=Hydrocarboniphaga sp. TaxID=2033016 RepID=UPI0026100DDD|nr:hypothetical protein [Hydrocarboniphaga sp.]